LLAGAWLADAHQLLLDYSPARNMTDMTAEVMLTAAVNFPRVLMVVM
jgi:hypothetical protein